MLKRETPEISGTQSGCMCHLSLENDCISISQQPESKRRLHLTHCSFLVLTFLLILGAFHSKGNAWWIFPDRKDRLHHNKTRRNNVQKSSLSRWQQLSITITPRSEATPVLIREASRSRWYWQRGPPLGNVERVRDWSTQPWLGFLPSRLRSSPGGKRKRIKSQGC